ncbi:glycosyltransferase family 2 protein [Arenimonas composti]|uniref:Glycosyltransferase 2-like domain-containing protein n=1 Tax=Arenimonas composti TR7-09 = DSM 18010 TaxID=1121013 RepID=A0A091BF34_9GAMM|nr:glycosyltransferase family 2 protein [Arenimonas composti]KFN51318.1 hypothetical protein P873_03360 [Arenimonas composti TR7-09 = DSM 18010]
MSGLPTVVVPVFNGLDALDGCLAALERTLPAGTNVLLADDASSDPRIAPLLAGFAARSRLAVRVVTRARNLGFPGNCNAAFAETGDADLVLLNSDTVVTTGWLQRLAACAAADPRIATVTPWSNNAEICSFPRFCEDNPPPDDPEAIAEAAAGLDAAAVELPTAVGFCMVVRRAALRALGGFDAATFGRGYGEENDFCLRAAAMGWRNVLCPQAYVVHLGGASFGPLGLAPNGDNLARLLARWPDYNERVARFILADPLALLRQRLNERIEHLARSGPQRDLFG